MSKARCFECARPADHNHHVVPESRGGTRTVPLCTKCHGLAHDYKMGNPALTKEGVARARARGVEGGWKRVEREGLALIMLKYWGGTTKELSEVLNINHSTLRSHKRKAGL